MLAVFNYFFVLYFLKGCVIINEFDNKVLLNQNQSTTIEDKTAIVELEESQPSTLEAFLDMKN